MAASVRAPGGNGAPKLTIICLPAVTVGPGTRVTETVPWVGGVGIKSVPSAQLGSPVF